MFTFAVGGVNKEQGSRGGRLHSRRDLRPPIFRQEKSIKMIQGWCERIRGRNLFVPPHIFTLHAGKNDRQREHRLRVCDFFYPHPLPPLPYPRQIRRQTPPSSTPRPRTALAIKQACRRPRQSSRTRSKTRYHRPTMPPCPLCRNLHQKYSKKKKKKKRKSLCSATPPWCLLSSFLSPTSPSP